MLLAVLNLLVFFFVAICRCCCKKCGGRPKAVGYTAYQRYTPVLFYVVRRTPIHEIPLEILMRPLI